MWFKFTNSIACKFLKNLLVNFKGLLPLFLLCSLNFLSAQTPELEVTTFSNLTYDDGNNLVSLNDKVTFTIKVKNTGNIQLSSVAVTSTLKGLNGASLSLTNSPVFNSSTSSSAEGTLLVGETVFYTAVYTLDQTAIESGRVNNCLTAQANVFSTGALVTDSIDSCVQNDIPHVTTLNTTKVASVLDNNNNGVNDVGDTIVYDIFIENQGNVTISNLDFTDNCIHGSGHCGCGKNYTAINAKLVILDTSIKSKFLAEMSYEPTPKTIPKESPTKAKSAKPIKTTRYEYCKKPPNTYKRCHSCGDVGHISKSCPKNRAPRNGKRNMFMSPSYIERCKIIDCKYGPNCTRRYSSTNPCYYNHNFKQ